MKTCNDKVFGQMSYDLHWERNGEIQWNGSPCQIELIVYSANEQLPSDEERNAYKAFVENSNEYITKGLEKLLAYCKINYDKELTLEKLRNQLKPTNLLFRRTGRWGITFACPWESEYDLAIVFKGDTVTAGLDDLII